MKSSKLSCELAEPARGNTYHWETDITVTTARPYRFRHTHFHQLSLWPHPMHFYAPNTFLCPRPYLEGGAGGKSPPPDIGEIYSCYILLFSILFIQKEELREHLHKAALNAKYTSLVVQNTIISLCENAIRGVSG